MILLIAEIGLTVAAWRKGWGARALLPIGACMAAGFFIGVAVGVSGGNPAQVLPLGILLDLGCVAGLIGMVRRAPAMPLRIEHAAAADATPVAA